MLNLNNVEAEEVILGGILIDPGAIQRVVETLKSEFFSVTAHQKIYTACLKVHRQGRATDLMSVTSLLADSCILESVGGQSKLAQLVDRTVSAVNIDQYVELIREKWQRRQLFTAGLEIAKMAEQTATPLSESLEIAEKTILSLGDDSANNNGRSRATYVSDALNQTFEMLQSVQQPTLRTGIRSLDKMIHGLGRKELITIAARPGMGKTLFGGHLALQIASKHRMPVIFFSAEMSTESLTKRFLSTCSGIDSQKIEWGEIETKKEWDAISNAVGTLSELPIIIDDTSGVSQTPSGMRAVLRRVQAERGQIGLIILDYIQLLGNRSAINRAQNVGEIAGECKAISKEFNCPFVALAQVNRGVESRNDKRPIMSDLKDSGDIEQDSDVCLVLYRDEYYNPNSTNRGEIEIIVRKQRRGNLGTAKAAFIPEIGIFKDIE